MGTQKQEKIHTSRENIQHVQQTESRSATHTKYADIRCHTDSILDWKHYTETHHKGYGQRYNHSSSK